MADDTAAARYHRLQFRLGALGFALGVASIAAVLVTGVAATLARAVSGWPW